ncbi:MAG: S26 family signal peptidase [Acidimicrobiales bacterium]|nr:S26 family signal peptidase [Acidimicrobiales bacterium]
MAPTLRAGDVVLVDPSAYRQVPPVDLDVVVLEHPYRDGLRIVKRVQGIDEHGAAYVVSDNPAETDAQDSRSFGPVPFERILGRVTAKVR